ncbi:MAG: zf-HC2 domain-containing protein [Oscillospiraceae bacterium]|nr:zf-HC2 domain-containing protein [Oscillospiraceae bacterium]
MKDCEAMQEQLSALLDGELDGEETRQVRAHLARCPDCRAFYAAMQELSGLLEPEAPPAALHAGIMARFDQRERVLARQKRLGRLRPLFSLAAAAAILVGTVLTLGRSALHFGKSSAPAETAYTYSVTAEAPSEAGDGLEQGEMRFPTEVAQAVPEADAVAECEEADNDEAVPEAAAVPSAEEPQTPAAARNDGAQFDATDKAVETTHAAVRPLPSPDQVSRAELERLPDHQVTTYSGRDVIALLLEGLDGIGDDAEAETGGWLSFFSGEDLLLRLYLDESALDALEAWLEMQE